MSTIIAGHFQLQETALDVCEAFKAAGFAADRISTFYNNPPGQHALTPIGGDRIASPGAGQTPEGIAKGELTGGAVGAALGAATIPVTGPLGPVLGGLVGAHVGSLYSFSEMQEKSESGPPPRKSGMMVAVAVTGGDEARALALMRQQGAEGIERAEGTIEDGDWKNFDPLSVPQFV
ncbi:membrane protein [Pseudoduganella violaceinigra]|uniref:membrane protein n=1 Tax=Pseudoduganella violaceinigra TaxID=246602 RepID=UPI0003FB45F4|nr:membrane protein [Pseudoduganella violaceinigra]